MRLHIASDLHLEHGGDADAPDVDADVTVLAGDVLPGTAAVAAAERWGRGRPVLLVAGNHEYYRHALPTLTGELRTAARGSAVRFLEDDEVVLGDVRFLGCTLWSDFEIAGAEEAPAAMALCARLVSDYRAIAWRPGGRALRPADTRALHARSRRWLAERLAAPHDGPTVVVTHHAPLVRQLPDDPVWRAIAAAFASDLRDLVAGGPAVLWIHGHTHRSVDLELSGTRVLSNPRGYPHDPVAAFDPGLVVEV